MPKPNAPGNVGTWDCQQLAMTLSTVQSVCARSHMHAPQAKARHARQRGDLGLPAAGHIAEHLAAHGAEGRRIRGAGCAHSSGRWGPSIPSSSCFLMHTLGMQVRQAVGCVTPGVLFQVVGGGMLLSLPLPYLQNGKAGAQILS